MGDSLNAPGGPLAAGGASGPVIRHYAGLLEALRNRAHELDVAYEEIERAARLPERYFAKVVCKPPKRLLHPFSIFNLVAALGWQMVFVPDPAAQLTFPKRRRRTMRSGLRITLLTPDKMRINGTKGGHARARKLSAAQRGRSARRAAKARWHKPRVVEITRRPGK